MKTDFIKGKKKPIIISSILIVALLGTFLGFNLIGGDKKAAAVAEVSGTAAKGSIKVEISGSGVIQPVERYDITPLVTGNIISAPFEEGQKVKKDDILYKFDATGLEGNIQKTRNSISKIDLSDKSTRDTLSETVIYAGASGKLTNFNIKENETVGGNKLGDIIDDSYRVAVVPFNKSQMGQISIGQRATVTSSQHMSSVEGTVSKVSSISTSQANGALLYDVEIKIPGATSLEKDTPVSAAVGNMESPEMGKIQMPDAYLVSSALSGRVTKVYAENNDYVAKGQKLLELDNDSYTSTLSRSALDRSDAVVTLEAQEKQLEDYNIKSPINGVVLKKNNKAGDTINSGLNALPLMVVADMSKVKFDMKIDELDIAKIKIGQPVEVVADALPDKLFNGRITSIAGEGTAVNGVSNYIVQVTIDDPGELKSGMNVSAKTIVAEKKDILVVPAAAVQKKDGKAYVLVPGEDSRTPEYVNIKIGINNKDYIEILEGLKEGDKVVMPSMAQNDAKTSGMGMMGGGGQGSRRPEGMDAFPR